MAPLFFCLFFVLVLSLNGLINKYQCLWYSIFVYILLILRIFFDSSLMSLIQTRGRSQKVKGHYRRAAK